MEVRLPFLLVNRQTHKPTDRPTDSNFLSIGFIQWEEIKNERQRRFNILLWDVAGLEMSQNDVCMYIVALQIQTQVIQVIMNFFLKLE